MHIIELIAAAAASQGEQNVWMHHHLANPCERRIVRSFVRLPHLLQFATAGRINRRSAVVDGKVRCYINLHSEYNFQFKTIILIGR